jgi:hypothetical protein
MMFAVVECVDGVVVLLISVLTSRLRLGYQALGSYDPHPNKITLTKKN